MDPGICFEGTEEFYRLTKHRRDTDQTFDAILQLDPGRAEELRLAHPELAKALERCPKGWESILDEAEAIRARMPPDPNQCCYVISANVEKRECALALM
jgi:hypothetical protein